MYKTKTARILRLVVVLALLVVAAFGIVVKLNLPSDPSDKDFYLLFSIVFFLTLTLLGHILWEEDLLRKLGNYDPRPRPEDADEFIYIASHQLRSFPATIRWYLESILRGTFGEMDSHVRAAVEKVRLMNSLQTGLIEDLLSTSRVDRGRLDFNFALTDLVGLISSVLEVFKPQAEAKRLALVFKPAKKLPQINLDKEKVRQIINNLIDNAIKFTQKGKVEVTVTKKDKYLVVSVSDTGEGLNSEQQRQIFLRFTRGLNTQHLHGLGLGLYVAKTLVNGHKGKLEVFSKGLGKGSTFKVYLPIR